MARQLRSVDTLLAPAVAAAIAELPLQPADQAAAKLASQYAKAIDDAEDHDQALATYGPKLLAALAALGATPTARRDTKGVTTPNANNPLAAIRAARPA